MTLKRATKNKIHLALHLLLCWAWERTRQKEKVRDWQSGASLNAETFEDFEEQVVVQGVPHLPRLKTNHLDLSMGYIVMIRANYWHVHTRQYHIGVCVHTWKSCISKVSERRWVSAHAGSEIRQETFSVCNYRVQRDYFQVILECFYTEVSYKFYINKVLKSKDNDMFPQEFWMLFLGKS